MFRELAHYRKIVVSLNIIARYTWCEFGPRIKQKTMSHLLSLAGKLRSGEKFVQTAMNLTSVVVHRDRDNWTGRQTAVTRTHGD